MKKIISSLLIFIFTFSFLNFNTFCVQGAEPTITQCYGWYEAIHIQWSNDSEPSKASVEYKKSGTQSYTPIDAELIRRSGSGCVADIVGISQGIYDVRITASSGQIMEKNNISVARHDRSGYGHFQYSSGIGGYNDNGTPKSNAQIVYVTNENKNTVKLGSYTGITKIMQNCGKSTPLIVRIIGKIDTQARDENGSMDTDKNLGIVAINGLTNTISTKSNGEKDSYFNMLDVSDSKNITVEGIGTDATIEKWGFTFKKCNSIEVRNITFTKYPEDACSFEGSSSSNQKYKNFWLHNNYFKIGENKYDVTKEQDKHEGDGSSDFKGCRNITFSYNVYERCHKTALHGGGDDSLQYNSTWHHNYLNNVSSRMPLTRQVNLHSYNNYFLNGGKCIDARASAWVLSEANNFENSQRFLTTANEKYGDPIVKSYMDVFDRDIKSDGAGTVVITTDRTLQIPANKGKNANKNPYPNFDTNTELFYYDSVNKKTDAEYITDGNQAKADVLKAAGVMKEGAVLSVYAPSGHVEESTETTTNITETSTEATTYASHIGERLNSGAGDIYTLVPGDINRDTLDSNWSKAGGVFTVTAKSDKTVTVNSDSINLGGQGTSGSGSYRAIAVNATGAAHLSVTFYNDAGRERILVLEDENSNSLTEVSDMNGSVSKTAVLKYDITSAGTYYIHSTNSSIKVTKVTLTYPANDGILIGDADGNDKIEGADAKAVLEHISDIMPIKDADRLNASDGNRDGKYTILDVIAILDYIKNK